MLCYQTAKSLEKKRVKRSEGSHFIHLDEGYLAGADVAFEVADCDLSIML